MSEPIQIVEVDDLTGRPYESRPCDAVLLAHDAGDTSRQIMRMARQTGAVVVIITDGAPRHGDRVLFDRLLEREESLQIAVSNLRMRSKRVELARELKRERREDRRREPIVYLPPRSARSHKSMRLPPAPTMRLPRSSPPRSFSFYQGDF